MAEGRVDNVLSRKRGKRRSSLGNAPGSGGGDGNGRLRNWPRFHAIPKSGQQRLPFVLIKGEYVNEIMKGDKKLDVVEPFMYYSKHYFPGRKKGDGAPFLGCSAGIQEKENDDGTTSLVAGKDDCVGCAQNEISRNWNEDDAPEGEPKPVTVGYASPSRVYSIVVMAWYHKIDSGKKNKKGYKIFNFPPCKGKTCPYCEEGNGVRFFGQPNWIELGRNHSATLDEIEEETVGRVCQCKGEIITTGFQCPECGHITEVDWDLLTEEDRVQLLYEDQRCDGCSEILQMNELIACTKCTEPRPLSIWDLVLWMERSGEGKETVLTLKRFMPIDVFFSMMAKRGEMDEETEADVRKLFQPLDFSRSHTVLDLEMQAKDLGINNMFEEKEDAEEEYREWKARKETERAPAQQTASSTKNIFDEDDDLGF